VSLQVWLVVREGDHRLKPVTTKKLLQRPELDPIYKATCAVPSGNREHIRQHHYAEDTNEEEDIILGCRVFAEAAKSCAAHCKGSIMSDDAYRP
jgi:hypothetical protein